MSSSEGQPAIEITATGPGPATTQVVEVGNGDAEVHYQCSVAGEYQLSAQLSGSDELIGGSHCTVCVVPDVVSVGSCQVGPTVWSLLRKPYSPSFKTGSIK